MELVVLNCLGYGDEADTLPVELLDDLGKVGQGTSEPIDLVDDYRVDLRLAAMSARSFFRPGRSMLPPEKPPSSYSAWMTSQPSCFWLKHVRFAGLALRVQGIEALIETLFR